MAQKLQELISHWDLQFQRKVLSHLLCDPLLLPIFLDYIVRCEKLLQCEIVCNGLAQAWKGVKSRSERDKALVRRMIRPLLFLLMKLRVWEQQLLTSVWISTPFIGLWHAEGLWASVFLERTGPYSRAIVRNTCPISGHTIHGNWHFVHNLWTFCWMGIKFCIEHL